MIGAVQQTLPGAKEFRIPTLLGLGLIILGIIAGVLLTFREQIFNTQAGPDTTPKNITLSNIEDESVTISWTTVNATTGSVKYGVSSIDEKTAVDIRDINSFPARFTHYVILKGLTPQTIYQYKVVSGTQSDTKVSQFTTAAASNKQNGFKPVIGSVIENNRPLTDGIVYLTIPGATLQSSLVGPTGGFIIPVGKIRKQDLSDIFFPEPKVFSQLKVTSNKGNSTANFRLDSTNEPVGTLKIGENLDFTTIDSKKVSDRYDLNGDGVVNVSDYSFVLNNIGLKTPNLKADVNQDGAVDQKDADAMIKQLQI